ncbi:MAG: ACT domain-containing protein [Clostridia bacterium]|nr:ACT domain-containing protein [Clostridia bacterium]
MRTIISVIGKDAVGIIAKISAILSSHKINVLDITQSVLDDMFVMVMLADISQSLVDFPSLVSELDSLGNELGLKIHTMHEDVFNSMHRI